MSVTGEAGHIFREPSGQRLHLQLQLGDAYRYKRKRDGPEAFTTNDRRHAEHWQTQESPVMRTSDGQIRWMNVTAYLKRRGTATKQIVFEGEPFTGLARMRAWARNGASTLARGGFGG